MGLLRPARLRLVRASHTGTVPTPAIDGLDATQRADLRDRQPLSYLAVTPAPVDHPGLERDAMLQEARRALDRLLAADVFGPRRPSGFYLLRLRTPDGSQVAVIAELAVDAIREGRLRLHEQVLPERSDHLAAHLAIVRAQSSPIIVAHRGAARLKQAAAQIVAERAPVLDFVAGDGLHQTVWSVEDPALLDELADEPLYLLDGHHRARAARIHADQHPDHPPAQWLMAALFPTDDVHLVAFDRLVVDPQLDIPAVVAAIADHADIESVDTPFRPTHAGHVGVYVAGRWYRVTVPVPIDDLVAGLPPQVVQRELLRPVFGIERPRTDPRLVHVPGDRPPAVAAAEVDTVGGVLVTVAPVTIDQLLAVADAGAVLPPKSTYVTPKPRSGVFLREL